MKVMVVMRHQLLRNAISKTIGDNHHEVTEGTDSGEQAVELYQKYRPDVVVSNIKLAGKMTIFDLITSVRQISPNAKIIGMSMTYVPEVTAELQKAKANGYVSQNSDPGTMLQALEGAANDNPFWQPKLESDFKIE